MTQPKIIYDGLYNWKGWGGKLLLGSGECRLRIFNLKKDDDDGPALLRPIIAVVSDTPGGKMSVKSCTSHIATCVIKDFNLHRDRMLWVEYYPAQKYGVDLEHEIPERLEAVDFEWREEKAIRPNWRPLKPPLLDEVRACIKMTPERLAQNRPPL